MWKCGIHFAYNYLYIYYSCILYTNCIHNFYDVHFLQIRTDTGPILESKGMHEIFQKKRAKNV